MVIKHLLDGMILQVCPIFFPIFQLQQAFLAMTCRKNVGIFFGGRGSRLGVMKADWKERPSELTEQKHDLVLKDSTFSWLNTYAPVNQPSNGKWTRIEDVFPIGKVGFPAS